MPIHWQIRGDATRNAYPPSQIIFNFIQYSGKVSKVIGCASTLGSAQLCLRNSESATAIAFRFQGKAKAPSYVSNFMCDMIY